MGLDNIGWSDVMYGKLGVYFDIKNHSRFGPDLEVIFVDIQAGVPH